MLPLKTSEFMNEAETKVVFPELQHSNVQNSSPENESLRQKVISYLRNVEKQMK